MHDGEGPASTGAELELQRMLGNVRSYRTLRFAVRLFRVLAIAALCVGMIELFVDTTSRTSERLVYDSLTTGALLAKLLGTAVYTFGLWVAADLIALWLEVLSLTRPKP